MRNLQPWQFLLIVNIILLIAGNFMEPSSIILILAPIVFPTAIQLGIDPIHLGIIMVVNMEIGMVTPPVGLNLFVASGITGMPLMRVVRASLAWLMVLLGFLVVVTYVPEISTYLPNALFGKATKGGGHGGKRISSAASVGFDRRGNLGYRPCM